MSDRVQSTNDNSSVSKASMINQGYFKDKFASVFVDKLTRRSPIINRGYFIRAHAINKILSLFLETFDQSNIKSQIISIGSGYDSAYFRLKDSNIFKEGNIYYEIDFFDLQKRKLEMINKSDTLCKFINLDNNAESHHNIVLNSIDYKLIGFDLRSINEMQDILSVAAIDINKPTLVLSEVVLAYLPPKYSNDVIQWAAHTFNQCLFVSYEQICPNDGFGQIMCNHFSSIGSPLLSIHDYPTEKSQIERYKKLGWLDANCCNMNDYYYYSVMNKDRLECLELFDEWEEWTLMCSHYIILLASNHIITQNFVDKYFDKRFNICKTDILYNENFQPKMETSMQNIFENIVNNGTNGSCCILDISNEKINLQVQRFGHSSTLFNPNDIQPIRKNGCNNGILTLGGFGINKNGHHSRINFLNINHFESSIDKVMLGGASEMGLAQDDCLKVYEAQITANSLISSNLLEVDDFLSIQKYFEISLMHHTCNYIGNGKFIIIGGRESPSKPLGVYCLHLIDNVVYQNQIQEIKTEMSPRWRHATSLINFLGTESLLIFGGCNLYCKNLDDFWILSESSSKKIEYFQVPGRHSHTMNRWGESKIVICGGVDGSTINPLADIFMLDFKEFTLKKIKLVSGDFIPRYSHTADIVGNSLIVFGGVTIYSYSQPLLTIIDLQRCSSVNVLIKCSETLFMPTAFFKHTMVLLFGETRDKNNCLIADRNISNISSNKLNIKIENIAGKYIKYLIIGGGGNCFSFGTLFNKSLFTLQIDTSLLNNFN